jgi:Peptidase A4 family
VIRLPRPSLRALGVASAAVAGLAIGLAPGATVPAATAAPAVHPAVWTAGPMVPNSPAVHPRPHPLNSTTQNWFGYAAHSGTYTSVESTWVQPAVDCSKGGGWVLLWVGLDGWGSPTVEQTGTGALCSGGQASYAAWWETFPNGIQFYPDPVKVGDKFSAKVTFEGSAKYDLYLTDQTQGWTEDNPQQAAGGATNASAEVVGETPTTIFGTLTNLPDFGAVTFTNSQVDGQAIASSNPEGFDLARNGDTLATTGGLSNGTDFTGTWQANY